ncbi:MAG: hypothetical protein Tsb0015_09130 [Simkaniaceae bacterium]
MKRRLLFILIPVLFTGCNFQRSNEALRYHDDGREKPVVTIVPIFDRAQYNVSWDLSEELTKILRDKILKKGNLFLTSEEGTLSVISRLDENQHPFDPECSWTKKVFNREQFVAFLELIEHDISPRAVKAPFSEEVTSNYYLDMLMRVRVVDLRKETPEIILQEFVNYSHKIPKQGLEIDYEKNHFGKSSYLATPLAVAHRNLCKKVTQRLEDYILLAKSK